MPAPPHTAVTQSQCPSINLGSVSHPLGNTLAFQGPQHKKEANSGFLYTHHHNKQKEQETNHKLEKHVYQQPVQTILFASWTLRRVIVIS